MATNTANVKIGAAAVSIGAYVTAGGAGSLTDVGHTKSGTTLAPSFNDYDSKSEQAFGTLKKVPQDGSIKLKVHMMEATLELLRVAMRQAAANLTGTPPNLTLRVGPFIEQYHQIQVAVPGVGTTQARTLTLWRGSVESVAEIPYAKGAEQAYEVTFDCLWDDSIGTADKIYKVVDA